MAITKLARLTDVMSATGLSRSTIYLKVAQGLWPKPIKIGQRISAWHEHEIDALISAFAKKHDIKAIRQLVIDLEQQRVTA